MNPLLDDDGVAVHLAPDVVVVGVEPGSLQPGSGLSAPVALAVPEMRHLVNAAAHGF